MKNKEYQTQGLTIYQKMQNGEQLTKEDMQEIKRILQDPLQEFCKREAPFRLCEFHNKAEDEVNEDLLGEVADIIRDVIDNSEQLYDDIDSNIRAKALKELKNKDKKNNLF